jgi:hypothetical protein
MNRFDGGGGGGVCLRFSLLDRAMLRAWLTCVIITAGEVIDCCIEIEIEINVNSRNSVRIPCSWAESRAIVADGLTDTFSWYSFLSSLYFGVI